MEEIKKDELKEDVKEIIEQQIETTAQKITRILAEHFKYDLTVLMISSLDTKGIVHTDVVFEDSVPFANLLLMDKTLDMRMDALCKTSLGDGEPSNESK